MPVVLRSGPYRFFFYSRENAEPPHVHVARDDAAAKFWLRPVTLARSHGFGDRELATIMSIFDQHEQDFERAWHGHFNA